MMPSLVQLSIQAERERKAAELERPDGGFRLGDKVETNEHCKFGEWKGIELTIVGMRIDLRGEVDIEVSEFGLQSAKGTADGFRIKELTKR